MSWPLGSDDIGDRVRAFAAGRRERRGMVPDAPLVVGTLTMPPWLLDALQLAPAPQRFYRFTPDGVDEVRPVGGERRGDPLSWEMA